MRKKILTVVSIIALVCLTAVTFVACNKKNIEEKSNISRMTSSFFIGESDKFAVTVEVGKREKVFIADGVATEVVNFQEIIVTPLVKNEFKSISYELSTDGSTLSGTLESNGFGEFVGIIELSFQPTLVTVTADKTTSTIELGNVLHEALTTGDIINIAKKEFADRIAKETAEGNFNREIYVKVISGDRVNYYYYVSFIGRGVDYWAMLVDPKTGTIVSKR